MVIKNFLNYLDCLPKDKLRTKLKEFFDEMLVLKKNVDKTYDDYGKLCDLARSEGYFYCTCCNEWKKPLPQ